MLYYLFTAIMCLLSSHCVAMSDAEIEQTIQKHRQSSSFTKFCEENKQGHHAYYQFLAWWQQERVRQDYDSMGEVTYALLTRAAGFGGWSKTQTANTAETNIFKNAGFLYYWDQYDAPTPTQAPAGVTKILSDAKTAALEKQCLLLPHHWLYPSNTRVPPPGSTTSMWNMNVPTKGTEPWDIPSWLDTLGKKGWKPDARTADEMINEIFGCEDSKAFQNICKVDFDEICNQSAKNKEAFVNFLTFSVHLARMDAKTFMYNPFVEMYKEAFKKHAECRGFLSHLPTRGLDTIALFRQSSLEYAIERALESLLKDCRGVVGWGIAQFLQQFDPINADTAKKFRIINTMQMFYVALLQAKLNSIKQNQSDQNTPIEKIFKKMFDENASKGLLCKPARPVAFPYSIIFESIFINSLIDVDDIFEESIKYINQSKYYAYSDRDTSPQALKERCRLVGDFLTKVHDEGQERNYVLSTAGQILGEPIEEGTILNAPQFKLLCMQQNAQEIVQKMIDEGQYGFFGDSGWERQVLKNVTSVELYKSSINVNIIFNRGVFCSKKIEPEDCDVLDFINKEHPDFCQDTLPQVGEVLTFLDDDSPYNMAAPNIQQRIKNKSRAIDFLIHKGLIPRENKLAIMLHLYHEGLI